MFWKKKNGTKPQEDPTSIGNILLRHGFITPEDLEEVVQYQKQRHDLLMGRAFVELGKLTEQELATACEEQTVVRALAKKKTADQIDFYLAQAESGSKNLKAALSNFNSSMEARLFVEEYEPDECHRRR